MLRRFVTRTQTAIWRMLNEQIDTWEQQAINLLADLWRGANGRDSHTAALIGSSGIERVRGTAAEIADAAVEMRDRTGQCVMVAIVVGYLPCTQQHRERN